MTKTQISLRAQHCPPIKVKKTHKTHTDKNSVTLSHPQLPTLHLSASGQSLQASASTVTVGNHDGVMQNTNVECRGNTHHVSSLPHPSHAHAVVRPPPLTQAPIQIQRVNMTMGGGHAYNFHTTTRDNIRLAARAVATESLTHFQQPHARANSPSHHGYS